MGKTAGSDCGVVNSELLLVLLTLIRAPNEKVGGTRPPPPPPSLSLSLSLLSPQDVNPKIDIEL